MQAKPPGTDTALGVRGISLLTKRNEGLSLSTFRPARVNRKLGQWSPLTVPAMFKFSSPEKSCPLP